MTQKVSFAIVMRHFCGFLQDFAVAVLTLNGSESLHPDPRKRKLERYFHRKFEICATIEERKKKSVIEKVFFFPIEFTDIDHAPWVSASTNFLPINVKNAIGSDHGKG